MKICIVVDNDVSHDTRVLKIKNSLSKKYNDVLVVGFGHKKLEGTDIILANSIMYNLLEILIKYFKKIISEKIFIHDELSNKNNNSLLSNLKNFFFDLARILILEVKISAIDKELSSIKAEIYHANDLPVLKICMRGAKRNQAKLIYDSHELYLEQGFFVTKFLRNKYFHQEKEGIMKADAIITVNEFIAKELTNRYHRSDINIIYNYPQRSAMPRNIITKKEVVNIIYQGRFDYGRGLKELILAMKKVPENYKLYLQGIGEYGEFLKELASKEMLLNKKLFFLRPTTSNNLIKEASFADVGVLFYEPYCLNNYLASPNKLFDYINTPLAIMSNDIPFIKKIIDDYRVGIYIKTIAPEEIAKAITSFTPDNIVEYKMASFRASRKLNWESEEIKLYNIYKNLLI
ncbi:MAG: glycosyltransferase family 4 protein [Candidatus Methanomethyliaceae archaeon]